ncbi:hypothetical protein JX266_000001 [Neoarthrinium moseri]|nr:hypothetical protein JX266_000001 [Neoarthrinium moseri]
MDMYTKNGSLSLPANSAIIDSNTRTLAVLHTIIYQAVTHLIWIISALAVVSGWIAIIDYKASLRDRKKKVNLPVLNLQAGDFGRASREWQYDYEKYMKEGYREYRHGAYQLWSPDGYVTVVSPDFLNELKNMPDNMCDFYSGAANAVQGKHKFFDLSGKAPIFALKSMMTPKLDELLPGMLEEVEYATKLLLPAETDVWHDLKISDEYARIVGYMTGRLFFGTDLNRQEDWLQGIIAFPDNVFRAARKLRRTPAPLKRLRLPFLREIQKTVFLLYKARSVLVPLLQDRTSGNEKERSDEPHLDFLQFVLEASHRESKLPTLARQSEQNMIIMLAGIHTTTIAGIHMLYDLAAMPHFIQPLRDEINGLWDECAGHLTKASMRKMVKLDTTFDRVITAPAGIVLSNGLHLPKGTVLTVPSSQVSMDPNVWANPEEYDALRFAKLREVPGAANNYQYPTSTEESLHFGAGRHACPGRWVSTIENKAILSYMIRHFDFRLIDPKQGRPKNLTFGPNVSPDDSAKIAIRRIRPHMM